MSPSSAVHEPTGPVDVAVVTFDDSGNAPVLEALRDLARRDVIRVIEFGLVAKDRSGTVRPADASTLFGDELSPVMSSAHLAIGDQLEPGSSAMVVVWENVWAARLTAALKEAGGNLVETTSSAFDDVATR